MNDSFDKMADNLLDYYKKLASMPNMTNPCAEFPLDDETECSLFINQDTLEECLADIKAKRENPPTNYGKW